MKIFAKPKNAQISSAKLNFEIPKPIKPPMNYEQTRLPQKFAWAFKE
jgi:hypothetical protein